LSLCRGEFGGERRDCPELYRVRGSWFAVGGISLSLTSGVIYAMLARGDAMTPAGMPKRSTGTARKT